MEDIIREEGVKDSDIELVDRMMKRVEGSRQQRRKLGEEAATIYRVSPVVRLDDEKAYEPLIVSIGPYHRGKLHLEAMEEVKLQFLDDHISKTPGGSMAKYIGMMKGLEARTRRCYSEDIKLGSDEFVEMMLLDGCFLVQFHLPDHLVEGNQEEQPLTKTMWFVPFLCLDLIKLENQLPFFIVECLFDALGVPDHKKDFFDNVVGTALANFPDKARELDLNAQNLQIHHLLYLLHHVLSKVPDKGNMSDSSCCCKLLDRINYWIQPPHSWVHQNHDSQNTDSVTACCCCNLLDYIKKKKMMMLPQQQSQISPKIGCATQLVEAGVKLKSTQEKTFLEISFHKGVLEIPTFEADEATNPIFRNLIALEQSCPQFGQIFTSYSFFMDAIINTSNDVALLEQEGIIMLWKGDHEAVASFFNRVVMNTSIHRDNDYLDQVMVDVNKYCRSRLHNWRARLVRDYFSSPWAIISVVAAVILLGFSCAQTVYTMLMYYHHN